MKEARALFIGILIGGGVGIATGTQISSYIGQPTWFSIELGLKIGGMIGMTIAIILTIIEKKKQMTLNNAK